MDSVRCHRLTVFQCRNWFWEHFQFRCHLFQWCCNGRFLVRRLIYYYLSDVQRQQSPNRRFRNFWWWVILVTYLVPKACIIPQFAPHQFCNQRCSNAQCWCYIWISFIISWNSLAPYHFQKHLNTTICQFGIKQD